MRKSRFSVWEILIPLLLLFLFSACQSSENALPENDGNTDDGYAARTGYNGNADMNNYGPQTVPLQQTLPAPAVNILGSYSTPILDGSKNRVNNIKLAVSEINGKTIRPGEVFSFNEAVGRRTSENGFRKARIILFGKKALGRGGGVCQVSSTLYSAVKKSGLEIVERHPHSKKVPYVKKGMDATVIYDSKDLKFRNNFDYAVTISADVGGNKVNIRIVKALE